MIPAARRFIAADLAAACNLSRIRERPPVPYYSRPPFSPSAASRSRHQPPHRRLLFLPKTAPFSSSVAFLTPPTFPAPAPRKRFFDLIPTKILGFRTRKGRPPRRQYLARARLEFRAGLRVVVSSRALAFGISCGLLACGAGGWLAALAANGSRYAAPAGLRGMVSLRGPARRGIFAGAGVWYLLRPAGLRGWWMAGRSGGEWLALCCACGPARHGISARACAFSISRACPAGGAGGWLAALPTAGAGRRPADRLPAVPTRRPHRSRPTRPPAVGLPICRRAGRSRRRGYLPRPVSSPDKLS